MIEYLVKRTDGPWFDFPPGSEPYGTTTIAFRKVKGWGDGRIEIDGCEISFSYEEPGVQVSFEGEISEEKAEAIAAEVCLRIEQVSGQKGEVFRIS